MDDVLLIVHPLRAPGTASRDRGLVELSALGTMWTSLPLVLITFEGVHRNAPYIPELETCRGGDEMVRSLEMASCHRGIDTAASLRCVEIENPKRACTGGGRFVEFRLGQT